VGGPGDTAVGRGTTVSRMTDDDLLSKVLSAADASEGYELRHFRVWREGRQLDVTLLDAGPSSGRNRYMVEVRDTQDLDGPYSLSNADDTIDNALSGVHWNEFPARD